MLRHSGPNARYLVTCGALVAMCAIPIVTAFNVRTRPTAPGSWTAVRKPPDETVRGHSSSGSRTESAAVAREVNMRRSSPTLSVLRRAAGSFLRRRVGWVVGAWALGVLFLSIRLTGALFYLHRLTRRATGPLRDPWIGTVGRLAKVAGLRGPVRAIESDEIAVPSVVGWLSPVLLLPVGGLIGLTPREVEGILAHEIAHIRRHDSIVNLLQTIAETVLFYHPAVWWVSHRIRVEREFCCDDLAVAICGDREVYARALAGLVGLRRSTPGLAPAADGGSVPARIARILLPRPTHAASSTLWTATFGIVLLLLGIGLGARLAVGEVVERETRAKLIEEIRTAIRAGDGARAIDLMPRFEVMQLKSYRPCPGLSESLGVSINHRYRDYFTPPANGDSLYRSRLGRWARPIFAYQFAFSRGARGCSMSMRDHLCVFGRQRKPSDPVYLRFDPFESPFITVDLDRDGVPELAFDGNRAEIRPDLARIEDRAPDGRRLQWLLGPGGSDPRIQPQIWMYKDGPFVAVVIDIDGDGSGDAGRSDVLLPGVPRPPSREEPGEWYTTQDSLHVADLVNRARIAIRQGDDATAVDQIVAIYRTHHMELVDPTFYPEWIRLFQRRYQTVSFKLPANADSMGFPDLFPGSFTKSVWMRPRDFAHPEEQEDEMTFCPSDSTVHRSYLTVREKGHPHLTVDLDLDEKPDVIYDGDEPVIIPGLSVVVDRDPDGRRVQWLIARPGTDPRQQAQIWILKDGPTVNIAIDVEGDGTASCAHGMILDEP